ncbi:hypothetical protein C7S18_20355 [Ahniella affigens]|uniref:UPF0225 protein C7S18_20355 n=1 Tax=Ahniella affigens TaxID=2021234 RepID=A0A2P1PX26_9GAMM|nr:YchJ family metal-binding protein [Ahniella affigens]AVP99380.1 hypothetical protein C7S18_20355 [Ahniella affigens]
MMPCPCGGKDYAMCCGRFHAGALAPSPEWLMRSRYTAYVRGDQQYLLATWHPSTRPAALDLDDAAQATMRWLGLTVKAAREDGDWGEVEFIARFRVGGQSAQRLHERSRFERLDGRWYYVDGVFVR